MDKANQRRIVKEMLKGLSDLMLGDLDSIPESWDGHELRQWMVDTAQEQFSGLGMDRKRMKAYRNDRVTLNI